MSTKKNTVKTSHVNAKKQDQQRMINKSNTTKVKTILKKIRTTGSFTSKDESQIRKIGKKVFHKNKISRLISRMTRYNG